MKATAYALSKTLHVGILSTSGRSPVNGRWVRPARCGVLLAFILLVVVMAGATSLAVAQPASVDRALEDIQQLINALPSEAFKPPAAQRRTAFENKLAAIRQLLAEGNILEAREKLQLDILAKLDGSFGGTMSNDWIISPEGQALLFPLVTDLLQFLGRTGASLLVGSEGGLVAVSDPASPLFGTTLEIPAGSVDTQVIVTISEAANVPPFQTGPVGLVTIELQPSGLLFDVPAILKVPYLSAQVVDTGLLAEEFLGLFTYDALHQSWVSIPNTSVDIVAKKVITNTLKHFSLVTVFGAQLCRRVAIGSDNCKQPYTQLLSPSEFLPLLLLHGWQLDLDDLGGGQPTWAFAPDLLLANGIDVWDLRYDGASELRKSAAILKFALSEIRRWTGAERVNIVAHSTGGLVARTYIQGMACFRFAGGAISSCLTGVDAGDTKLPYSSDVNGLLAIGTPHFGAAVAAGATTLREEIIPLAVEAICQQIGCVFGLASLIESVIDRVLERLTSTEFLTQAQPGSAFLDELNAGQPVPLGARRYQAVGGNACLEAGFARCFLTGSAISDGFIELASAMHPAFINLQAVGAFHSRFPSQFYCVTVPGVGSKCWEPGHLWNPGLVFISDNGHPVFAIICNFVTVQNEPPTVTNLTANPTTVPVGGQSIISVVASDPDDDLLTYDWSATCGTLSSTIGPQQKIWTAPSTLPPSGSCAVMVTVTDPFGASATTSVAIEVSPTPAFIGVAQSQIFAVRNTVNPSQPPEGTVPDASRFIGTAQSRVMALLNTVDPSTPLVGEIPDATRFVGNTQSQIIAVLNTVNPSKPPDGQAPGPSQFVGNAQSEVITILNTIDPSQPAAGETPDASQFIDTAQSQVVTIVNEVDPSVPPEGEIPDETRFIGEAQSPPFSVRNLSGL